MNTQEISSALQHESLVLVVSPAVLSIFWFIMYMLSVDPPFFGWLLVIGGLGLAEYLDNHRFGRGLNTTTIGIRGCVNVVVAVVCLLLSGSLTLLTGPPTPRGPFSSIQTFLAFVLMLSVVRAGEHLFMLVNRFDIDGMVRWFGWNDNDRPDSGTPRPDDEN